MVLQKSQAKKVELKRSTNPSQPIYMINCFWYPLILFCVEKTAFTAKRWSEILEENTSSLSELKFKTEEKREIGNRRTAHHSPMLVYCDNNETSSSTATIRVNTKKQCTAGHKFASVRE